MSWTQQVLNNVTSRISAASQSLSTPSDPLHSSYPSGVQAPHYSDQVCDAEKDSQTSSMSVRLQLDDQNAPYYTNLDFVSGIVLLNLSTDTSIAAINVKLEGESSTRLSGFVIPNDPAAGQKINSEVHKLLYKTQTVFPGPDLTQDAANARFTLPAGQYSYRFSIKIPINNDCTNNTTVFSDLKRGRFLGPEITGARHVKQTLPPTLAGFPGQAEIKYFVKVTVVRPKFYQENIRSYVSIRFQPIEPPRPPFRNEETYARRQHQFQATVAPAKSNKSGFFKKTPTVQVEEIPLAVKVEARLPSPTIVYCRQPLPLRLMVERLNDSSASIYLSLLQIELIGFTTVRAQELARTETGSWVIMSQANMKLQLDNPVDKSNRSLLVPPRFWETLLVPDTVAPTFHTCNISRKYELEVRIGLSHGMADGIRPELVVLPLRIPVEVYSGVKPPAQLLNRIDTQIPNRVNTQQPSSSNLGPPQFNNMSFQPSPVTPAQDLHPPQLGTYTAPPMDDPNDLPPSYEDAMAEDITPADGPRRDHTGSTSTTTPPLPFNADLKNTSGLNRHGSERLFSQNAPSPPIGGKNSSSTQRARLKSTTPDGREATTSPTGLNANDATLAAQSRPPPLPTRKGTADSTMGKKN